jgi:hypothetical protein
MATPPESPGASQAAFNRRMIQGLAPSIVLNAVCPYVLFQILSGCGVPTLQALLVTSVFPIAGILVGWARSRHLDAIGLLSLILIALGVLTSLISGDVRFYLVKESALTGAFGLVCLVSLLLPRPLLFYFGRQFAAAGDPGRATWFSGLWRHAQFRRGMRLITAVWGVGLVCEALIGVGLALTTPPSTVLAVRPVLAIVVTCALILWTVRYGAAMRRRGQAEAARQVTAAGAERR